MQRRELTAVSSLISTIQTNEKEKLLLYAAKHMDELQAGSALLKPYLDTTPQAEYNETALQRLEQTISEALEGIQCEKVDLVEAPAADASAAVP